MEDNWDMDGGGMSSGYLVSYEDAIREGPSRILFMGATRSGKTSIERVVFHKMSPHETLFIESTNSVDIHYIANNNLVRFQTWDFGGNINLKNDIFYNGRSITIDKVFSNCSTLVYVIDCQEENFYAGTLPKLVETISIARSYNASINFEIFLHKVDGDFMSEETKSERQQKIQQYVSTEMTEGSGELLLSYYLTSIYDHSALEAFSKVVQKLVPQLPVVNRLLDCFIASCCVDKSYLVDIATKLYIATDSNPVDGQTYELCSDLVDVVMDVSCIYGVSSANSTSFGPFDNKSASTIHLDNGMVLYLREVDSYLALICFMREEHFARKSLLDYNIDVFKGSLGQVFDK